MSRLKEYTEKIKPLFEPEGKLHAFHSVYDGLETFLFVPNTTSKSGTHIHDAILICPGFCVSVENDNLAEEVTRVLQ